MHQTCWPYKLLFLPILDFFLILYRLLIISLVWIMNLYRLQPWGTYLFPINFKILSEFWFFMFVSERNDLFLYFPESNTLFCGLISLVLVLSQFWLYFQQQNSYKNTHTCIYMYIYIIEGCKRSGFWTIRSFPEKKQMFYYFYGSLFWQSCFIEKLKQQLSDIREIPPIGLWHISL